MFKIRITLLLVFFLAVTLAYGEENTLTSLRIQEDMVEMEVIEKVADTHAYSVWGTGVKRGTPLPVYDEEDRLILYAVPYVKDGVQFPSAKELSGYFDELKKQFPDNDRNLTYNDYISSIKNELEKYGTVYVSALKSCFPVPRVTHGLHPYYYNLNEALEKIRKQEGCDRVALKQLRFVTPCYEFFEITGDEKNYLLQVNNFLSLTSIREKAKEYADDTGVKEKAEILPVDRKMIDTAWNSYLETYENIKEIFTGEERGLVLPLPPSPENEEFRIDRHQMVPPILWTRWCEPTAVAMAFSYYDHYVPVPGVGTYVGYERIVDYWLNHPESNNNVPNVLDEIADYLNVYVTNTINGYNWTVTKTIGDSSNDFGWTTIKNHLKTNKPVVWQVHGAIHHANCVFGYRTLFNEVLKYCILYNTWSESEDEWMHNAYGQPFSSVEVDRYVPGGKENMSAFFIRAPYGGETFQAGQFNSIIFYVIPGSDIKIARIEYSLDGGNTWNFMVETWTNPGWNTWKWKPSSISTRARIRIKGLSANRSYISGDGSFRNFVIQ